MAKTNSTNSAAVVVKFNNDNYTFKNRAALIAQVKKADANNPAPDAKGKGLKHRIFVPGLKAPTSIGWVALHLFKTAPQGISENGKSKGAYHPVQLMSAASKLAPLGVKVESEGESVIYAPWSKTARAALDKMSTARNKGSKTAKRAAPKKSAKTAKKVANKK